MPLAQGGGDNIRIQQLAKAIPLPGEELRIDDITAGDLYIGAAAGGTATSSSVWDVVKYTRDSAGKVQRLQFRSQIVWDDRTSGW